MVNTELKKTKTKYVDIFMPVSAVQSEKKLCHHLQRNVNLNV